MVIFSLDMLCWSQNDFTETPAQVPIEAKKRVKGAGAVPSPPAGLKGLVGGNYLSVEFGVYFFLSFITNLHFHGEGCCFLSLQR